MWVQKQRKYVLLVAKQMSYCISIYIYACVDRFSAVCVHNMSNWRLFWATFYKLLVRHSITACLSTNNDHHCTGAVIHHQPGLNSQDVAWWKLINVNVSWLWHLLPILMLEHRFTSLLLSAVGFHTFLICQFQCNTMICPCFESVKTVCFLHWQLSTQNLVYTGVV